MGKNNLEVTADNTSIYEGGALSPISIDDLVNNEVAIRQLVNAHNLSAINLKNKEDEINNLKSQTEYLKTSPFVSILTLIINVIGTAILGIAANLMTSQIAHESATDNLNNDSWDLSTYLFITGIGLIILSSTANILYPYARKWFNKEKDNATEK